MFNIDFPEGLAEEHYAHIKERIAKRLKDSTPPILNNVLDDLITWLKDEDNLKSVICGKPFELQKIYASWKKQFPLTDDGEPLLEADGFTTKKKSDETRYGQEIIMYFNKIFDYQKFSDGNAMWGAYKFCERLNTQICPYCNRAFIYTIEKEEAKGKVEKLIRPELDHFFSKSRYPMFALSAYNLIPCCHLCNSSIKKDIELDLKEYFHPYVPEDKEFSFYYTKGTTTKTQIKLEYKGNEKAKNTCGFFELEEIYKYHNNLSDKAEEMRQEFDAVYVEDIRKKLNSVKVTVSKERLLDIIYDYYRVDNPSEEILGKLRSDILKQIMSQYT